MKNVLIVMLCLIVLFSAFDIALPKHGLSYEVAVNNTIFNLYSWVTSVSNVFGFSEFINNLFGMRVLEDITLNSDSQFRLLMWDDYYIVQVVEGLDIELGSSEIILTSLISNYPSFYYASMSNDGSQYYLYDVYERRILTLSNTDFLISDIYLYSDFQNFLTSNAYSFADRVIEVMNERLEAYAGGR